MQSRPNPNSYREVFEQNTEDRGTPNDPTPNGFLALAQAGRQAWNAWRADYPTEWDEATRSWRHAVKWNDEKRNQHVALHRIEPIDFSGYDFGDGADFSHQEFPKEIIRFDKARFGDSATFSNSTFLEGVSFRGAGFGRNALLTGLEVRRSQPLPQDIHWAQFDCRFGDGVSFQWVSFQGGRLCLDDTKFGNNADLSHANFGERVSFQKCKFGKNASFRNATIRVADFSDCQFDGAVDFRGTPGDGFGEITFTRTKFLWGR